MHTQQSAYPAPGEEDEGHAHVYIAHTPVRITADSRRPNDLRRASAHRHEGWHTDKNQQRGDQKTATDPRQTGEKTDDQTKADDQPDIHRHMSDRKEKLQLTHPRGI